MTAFVIRMSLERQLFLLAVAAVGLGTIGLLVLPVTVSVPVTGGEALVLVLGALLLLVAFRIALLRILRPLHRLARAMQEIDPVDPVPDLRRMIEPDDRDVDQLLMSFEQMLRRFRQERHASDRRMLATQEAEQRRIARELHDELGQTLTALKLQIERAGIDGATREPIARTVSRALDEVRGIALRLRPEALDDLGLVNALLALARRVTDESGIPVERELDGPLPPLAPDAELALYRIAQEALTNVVRHAGATRATIVLRVDGGDVELTVRDDGRGLGDARAGGRGIAGMRERARLVGARIALADEGGAVVRVRLPAGAPLVVTGEGAVA
ncbi:HAMP domain-containing sensor histidine kinase [Patulibacter defluvii]|uniref:HAMP domain-containing sensor histidine kinase n=1 Tax=Patulibacter defluvii TaxID=3095358 RepID=UPI002A7519BC|nr:ATP-binding protein [Patulibacter sp. DM4]